MQGESIWKPIALEFFKLAELKRILNRKRFAVLQAYFLRYCRIVEYDVLNQIKSFTFPNELTISRYDLSLHF